MIMSHKLTYVCLCLVYMMHDVMKMCLFAVISGDRETDGGSGGCPVSSGVSSDGVSSLLSV